MVSRFIIFYEFLISGQETSFSLESDQNYSMASSEKLIMLYPGGFVKRNEFLKKGYLFKFLQIEFCLNSSC